MQSPAIEGEKQVGDIFLLWLQNESAAGIVPESGPLRVLTDRGRQTRHCLPLTSISNCDLQFPVTFPHFGSIPCSLFSTSTSPLKFQMVSLLIKILMGY